jgi:hypothetical protein
MSKLTTSQGVSWEILTINDRSAYQAGNFLVFWDPMMAHYKLVDGLLAVCMSGTLQDCLECVRHERDSTTPCNRQGQ